MSRQAFAILDRIADVNAELQARPAWRGRLREIHPELCFYFFNGERPMAHAKRTTDGGREIAGDSGGGRYGASDGDARLKGTAMNALIYVPTSVSLEEFVAYWHPAYPEDDDALLFTLRISAN